MREEVIPMKWCAISDTHGEYEKLIKLEKKVLSLHPDIQFIYLGDFVDRGPDSKRTLFHIMEQTKKGHVAIKGNHDIFFEEFLTSQYLEYPVSFGMECVRDFFPKFKVVNYGDAHLLVKKFKNEYKSILPFLQALPLMHEIEGTVFIHGGFNPHKAHYMDSTETELTMPSWKMPAYAGLYPDKQFVFGHVPSMNYHQDKTKTFPYQKENFTFIDGGSVFGGHLNAYLFDSTYLSV